MCVQRISAQCVLQFTPSLAAGCVLHRPENRVIHRLESCSLGFQIGTVKQMVSDSGYPPGPNGRNSRAQLVLCVVAIAATCKDCSVVAAPMCVALVRMPFAIAPAPRSAKVAKLCSVYGGIWIPAALANRGLIGPPTHKDSRKTCFWQPLLTRGISALLPAREWGAPRRNPRTPRRRFVAFLASSAARLECGTNRHRLSVHWTEGIEQFKSQVARHISVFLRDRTATTGVQSSHCVHTTKLD